MSRVEKPKCFLTTVWEPMTCTVLCLCVHSLSLAPVFVLNQVPPGIRFHVHIFVIVVIVFLCIGSEEQLLEQLNQVANGVMNGIYASEDVLQVVQQSHIHPLSVV